MLVGCEMAPEKASLHLRSDQVQVREGETIYTLAEKHHVTVTALMEANGLPAASVMPGEILVIPKPGQTYGQKAKTAYVPLDGAQVAAEAEMPADAVPLSSVDAVAVGGASVAPQVTKAPSEYIWPVRGSVVRRFGQGSGPRKLGVFISSAQGTSVKVAKDGEVVYTGNDLESYGPLVLVRHENGAVTAYGDLQAIQVEKGDTVAQGQKLGEVGAHGKGKQTALYFELREAQDQGSKPKAIDPFPKLG